MGSNLKRHPHLEHEVPFPLRKRRTLAFAPSGAILSSGGFEFAAAARTAQRLNRAGFHMGLDQYSLRPRVPGLAFPFRGPRQGAFDEPLRARAHSNHCCLDSDKRILDVVEKTVWGVRAGPHASISDRFGRPEKCLPKPSEGYFGTWGSSHTQRLIDTCSTCLLFLRYPSWIVLNGNLKKTTHFGFFPVLRQAIFA